MFRRIALVVVCLAALIATPIATATAHEDTKSDGNDTPGRLDLKSASVGHGKGLVHTVKTFAPWKAKDLGSESFFLIAMSFDDDHDYERCAFIFFFHKLRGSLTNCGANFLRTIKVTKTSPRTAEVVIPKEQVHKHTYWWSAISVWVGDSPCKNGCGDSVPNHFPLIMHDIEKPTVSFETSDLLVSDSSTSSNFPFPMTVDDEHSGIGSWEVQARDTFLDDWEVVVTGTDSGDVSPIINGPEGSQREFRVVVYDQQDNKTISGHSRFVFVPFDDANPNWGGSFLGNTSVVVDAEAYGGSYTSLDDGTASFTYLATDDPSDFTCRFFKVIGPGSGDWMLSVEANGVFVTTIDATTISDGPRQVLYDDNICSIDVTYEFTLVSGSGAGIDAVLS